MRPRSAFGPTLLALGTLIAATGCYRGAIYASYQQAGLGIKATAESNSPIKVHFGYDRGVGAWVPRRGGDDEEATSLISRDDVRANANPTNLDAELLQADGVVITGTAAIVASAPPNALVKVVEVDSVLEVQTRGRAGERIATALTTVALSDAEVGHRDLLEEIAGRDDAADVCRSAAAKMSDRFQTLFRQRLAIQPTVMSAFKSATLTYTNEVADSSARLGEVTAALRAAAGKD